MKKFITGYKIHHTVYKGADYYLVYLENNISVQPDIYRFRTMKDAEQFALNLFKKGK